MEITPPVFGPGTVFVGYEYPHAYLPRDYIHVMGEQKFILNGSDVSMRRNEYNKFLNSATGKVNAMELRKQLIQVRLGKADPKEIQEQAKKQAIEQLEISKTLPAKRGAAKTTCANSTDTNSTDVNSAVDDSPVEESKFNTNSRSGPLPSKKTARSSYKGNASSYNSTSKSDAVKALVEADNNLLPRINLGTADPNLVNLGTNLSIVNLGTLNSSTSQEMKAENVSSVDLSSATRPRASNMSAADIQKENESVFNAMLSLNWRDKDEALMSSSSLNRITLDIWTDIYQPMKRLSDELFNAISSKTGALDDMAQDEKYNFLFHIIAKGEAMYYQTIADPEFCLYLLDQYQPLYTMVKKMLRIKGRG
jgi:hypothetical protein